MTYRKALDKMDRILEQNLLYDFYGELLTEHQQRVYEDAVYNDMSLSEIAGEQGISRQGVHDLIKRCDKIMKASFIWWNASWQPRRRSVRSNS